MSTARIFRAIPPALHMTVRVLYAKWYGFAVVYAGAMWGLIACEDRYTHLWNTYHGGSQFMNWFPGLSAVVLGFLGIFYMFWLIIEKPGSKK